MGTKVTIGEVDYIGAELMQPYFWLWSKAIPLSKPARPYTHIMRGKGTKWRALYTFIAIVLFVLAMGVALVWDPGRLKGWQRFLILAVYTAVVAIAAHVFWCGAETIW